MPNIVNINDRRQAIAAADRAARDAKLQNAARLIASGVRLAGSDGDRLAHAVLRRLK